MLLYKALRKIFGTIIAPWEHVATVISFWGNDVRYGKFHTSGIPYVMVARGGKMNIGNNFAMNNGVKGNPIGCYQKCTFFVDRGAEITIGDNVGISQTALISHCSIEIGKNVKMGGGYLHIYH